jgi:hypothetical protein
VDTTPPPTDPPPPTDTPTLEPTLTLEPTTETTPEITADATLAPTEVVPTVEVTAEATPALTEVTPTAELTDLPTATPTPFPTEPPLTLLFSDTFDSGALYLWTLGAGWSLTPNEGGQALTVSGSDAPLTFVHNTLIDAAAEARVRFDTCAVRLSLQASAVARYSLVLDANGAVTLYRGETALASGAVSAAQPGGWRTLRLSIIAGVLRASVDGVEVLTTFDDAPLPPGTLTIESIGGNALTVDDVSVWLAGDLSQFRRLWKPLPCLKIFTRLRHLHSLRQGASVRDRQDQASTTRAPASPNRMPSLPPPTLIKFRLSLTKLTTASSVCLTIFICSKANIS